MSAIFRAGSRFLGKSIDQLRYANLDRPTVIEKDATRRGGESCFRLSGTNVNLDRQHVLVGIGCLTILFHSEIPQQARVETRCSGMCTPAKIPRKPEPPKIGPAASLPWPQSGVLAIVTQQTTPGCRIQSIIGCTV